VSKLAPVFKNHGVDEVICTAVNDAFVMNEWQADQNAWNLTFLPDGNGHFAHGMGMLVAKEDLGFSDRSWRYSMLVRDGVIEKMFVEPDQPGDPFEVSDADTMLGSVGRINALFPRPIGDCCRAESDAAVPREG
jgi:peroxiredoxin